MSKRYKVGYKKPPAEHRWKPGQSGNPSGQKGKVDKALTAKSLRDYLAEELLEKMTPTVDGRKQEMPTTHAIAKAMIRDLMTSKPREKIFLIRELNALGVFDVLGSRIHQAQMEASSKFWISEEERRAIEIAEEAVRLSSEGES